MSKDKTVTGSESRQRRRRMRGYLGTREGKAVGFASIAAPIIGFVVNDLRKQDSIVRRLATTAVNRLLEHRPAENKAVDITDRVKVTTIDEKGAESVPEQ